MSGHNRGHSAFSTTSIKQNVPNKERGFILISVVIAITLVATIAFALSYQGAGETNITTGEIERDQLRYVAEAGMAHAKLQLAQNTACAGYSDIPATAFSGDSYSAAFSSNKDSPITIKSTGLLRSGAEFTLQSDAIKAYQAQEVVTVQLDTTSGKDTMIDSFYADANYGSVDDLIVRSKPSWMQRPLLEFDMTKISSGVRIVTAKLELQQRIIGTAGVIGVHRVSRSWNEGKGNGTGNADGATWNEYDGASTWGQPGGDFASTLYATAATTSAKNGRWVAWDIRDLVEEWVSGRFPNYGLILVGDGVVDNAEFSSREEPDPTAAPKLTIVYTCECGKTCTGTPVDGKNVLLVVGDLASLTPEQADKKALMEGWGHTVTLIATSETQAAFDTAAALVDVVYVPELGATPMSELDTKADDLAVGVITEEARTAIKLGSFSLFPFVDATSINIVDNTHYITEALPTGNVVLSTATQSFWKLAGTLAPDLHVLGQLSGSVPGLAYVDVGETVNDGNPAPGRRVKLPWGSYNFDVNLLTADGLEIMKRAIEWGGSSSVSKKLLFVVGNDTNLTTEETAHQALVESWGYTVELIDDDATQAEFDTAAAANDVAFITNSITASRLSTKLVDHTIGVVTSEDNLSDEFGLSSTIGWDSGTVVEINDNSHYITSPFPTGLLTILSSSESLAYVSGTLSPDLGQLASSTSSYAVVTLDAGATMFGGGSAAGRRVQLPWGGNGFDPGNLNADGVTILQRAIEWGAGAGPAPPAPGYLDEFNNQTCDPALDYAGSDGALDWSPWLWTEINESDGSCAGQIQVAADSAIPDPESFRLRAIGQGVRVYRTVDLSGLTQPTLSFDYRLLDYPALDFMRIRVFDGVGYNEIGRFDGPFDQTAYQSASFDLSAYAGLEIQVQFEFNGTSTTRTSYIDNVHIQEGGGGGGGSGGEGDITFEEFAEASLDIDGLGITVPKPAGTAAGDLLIAAVVTDAEQKPAMTAPSGWTLIDHGRTSKQVTMDVLWKIANASEPGSYDFSWVKSQEAYGWIMRFTGHDPAAPIHNSQSGGGTSSSPVSPAVTTTIANTMIVRIGGFDDDDITAGDPGLSGHTAITMGASGTGTGTASGGAGYILQSATGDSGTSTFSLTSSEEYRAVTIAIAPAP